MKKIVLVVDDEKPIREMLTRFLNNCDCEADNANNGIEALKMLEQKDYDIVITDCYMPEMNGIELTRWIKARYPSTCVICISGQEDPELLYNAGAEFCFKKPFNLSEIKEAIQKVSRES